MNFKNFFLFFKKPFLSEKSPVSHNNNQQNSYIKSPIQNKTSYTYQTGKVSTDIRENLDFINDAFETSKNFDLVVREFEITLKSTVLNAFLIFYDGLSNKEYINRDILSPLMSKGAGIDSETEGFEDIIYTRLLSQAPNTKIQEMRSIIDAVSFGNCAVFVDGCSCAFVADIKGWSSRSVGRPISEAVLSGPQEAFCESLMPNIALVRKILKDPNLIAENIPIGSKSNTPCALMYINGITNRSLVKTARERLKSISLDYVFSSADIELLIEDSTIFPLPLLLKTERPDRAASHLANGKVLIIVQGSPFALILPATASDLPEAAEDNYVRTFEANFMRLIRLIGSFLALFLPGFFISTVLYHHESIPTDLIIAIEASREQMPFPIVLELIIMTLAFELIKEAAIRVPDPIGSSLGIVGGLILGQSAVSANIASPLLIIIVSISALGAFSAPSTAISRALSFLQFVFIVLGALSGFLGIAFGIFLGSLYLSASKSFGVPYLSPNAKNKEKLFVPPIWRRETRPEVLNPQEIRKQPHISRKWKGDQS